MLKNCTNCGAEYYARWGNEPVELCLACRTDVVLCDACQALIKPPPDAAQLAFWPFLFIARPKPLLLADQREPHFSHGRVASQREQRKYPYQ